MLIRLLGFRPAEPNDGADRYVRDVLQPGLIACAGLRFIYFGRSSTPDIAGRVVLTVWDDHDPACPDEADLTRQLDVELADAIVDPSVSLHDARLVMTSQPSEPPRIMRIFRGTLHPGQLEEFVNDAEAITDSILGFEPHAVFLGSDPPSGIVALSIWSDWDGIVGATRGDIENPILTRQTQRLKTMSAEHFEIVPGTRAGPIN